MNAVICMHCGQARRIGSLRIDVAMYLAHLLRDHPEVIKEAEELIATLTPEFDWQTAAKF